MLLLCRASAARRAIALRSNGESDFALAFPPADFFAATSSFSI
jgi:hypothetical protein